MDERFDLPPPEPPRPKSKGRRPRSTGPAIPDEGLGGIVAPVRAKAPRPSSPTPATRMPTRSGESSPNVPVTAARSPPKIAGREDQSSAAAFERTQGGQIDALRPNGKTDGNRHTATNFGSSSALNGHAVSNGSVIGSGSPPEFEARLADLQRSMFSVEIPMLTPPNLGVALSSGSSIETLPPMPIPLQLGPVAPLAPLPFSMGSAVPAADVIRRTPASSSQSSSVAFPQPPVPIPLSQPSQSRYDNRQAFSRGFGSVEPRFRSSSSRSTWLANPADWHRGSFPTVRRPNSFPPSYRYLSSPRSPGRVLYSGVRPAGPSRTSRSSSPLADRSPRQSLPPMPYTRSPRISPRSHGSITLAVSPSGSHRHRQNMYATEMRPKEYPRAKSPFRSPVVSARQKPAPTRDQRSPFVSPAGSPRWPAPTIKATRRYLLSSKSPSTSPQPSPRAWVPFTDDGRRPRRLSGSTARGTESGHQSPVAGYDPHAQAPPYDRGNISPPGERGHAVHPSSLYESQAMPLNDSAQTEGFEDIDKMNPFNYNSPPTLDSEAGKKKSAPPPILNSRAGSRWQVEVEVEKVEKSKIFERLENRIAERLRLAEEGWVS